MSLQWHLNPKNKSVHPWVQGLSSWTCALSITTTLFAWYTIYLVIIYPITGNCTVEINYICFCNYIIIVMGYHMRHLWCVLVIISVCNFELYTLVNLGLTVFYKHPFEIRATHERNEMYVISADVYMFRDTSYRNLTCMYGAVINLT